MYTNKIGSRRDVVLSGLALSLASVPAIAQSTGDESVEEVVVLGSYAQSLKSALDRKRNADGVVDAITAEDIGKYPDTNLAESLARISGGSDLYGPRTEQPNVVAGEVAVLRATEAAQRRLATHFHGGVLLQPPPPYN